MLGLSRFLSAETIDDMDLMEQIATPLLIKLLENKQILLVSLDQISGFFGRLATTGQLRW